MRIVITNVVALNGGDAAILYGMINILKRSFGDNTHIVVFDNDAAVASRYYPDIEFRQHIYAQLGDKKTDLNSTKFKRRRTRIQFRLAAWCWQHKLRFVSRRLVNTESLDNIRIYDEADFILSTGGTILVEHYALKPRIFDLNLCLQMNKPLAFFTQSLGPFKKPQNIKALTKIFNYASALLVRDQSSKQHLIDLGIPENSIELFPDGAFALHAPPHSSPSSSEGLNIALSVRDWPFFTQHDSTSGMARYIDTIQHAVTHLIEHHQATLTFISTCQGIEEYWKDDAQLAHKIVDGLPDNLQKSITIDQQHHTPIQLLNRFSDFNLVIATRMHVAILALCAHTPVLPIAYEFKTKELFEQLELQQWVQDIETMSEQSLLSTIDALVHQLPDIHTQYRSKIDALHDEAYTAGEYLKKALS